MKTATSLRLSAGLALALCPLAATAQGKTANFDLGLGVGVAPAYEGSDEYTAGPSLSFGLTRLDWWFFDIDKGDGMGFGVSPSLRILSERTAEDHARLKGLDDVDTAVELGVQVSYRWPNAEVFGALRKGVTGHDGLVMDLGADAVLTPAARTELRVGPRMSLADDTYADTYFDVPTGATLAAHDAGGGLYSVGLEVSLRRDFNQDWAVEGTLGWTRLTGSVGDSTVVENRDQGNVSVRLVRTFDWRW